MDSQIDYGLDNLFTMSSVNVLRGEGENVGGPTLEREVADTGARLGIQGMRPKGRKLFDYDRALGVSGAKFQYAVAKSDRMAEEAAGVTLTRIHEAYQLVRLPEEVLYDFDNALFVCYAINGSSQQLPFDRVYFYVGNSKFDYAVVYNLLGIDSRRFYRAMADEVLVACKQLYYNFDPANEDQVYARDMMIQVAEERNLSRAPYLIADSIDSARDLTPTERALARLSKQTVIGNTPNVVDRRALGTPIRSLDNYDSSNMKNIPSDVDIHKQSEYYH